MPPRDVPFIGALIGPFFGGVSIDHVRSFTRRIDSKFDSTKALINKTGRALRERQSGFCRAFVQSKLESTLLRKCFEKKYCHGNYCKSNYYWPLFFGSTLIFCDLSKCEFAHSEAWIVF